MTARRKKSGYGQGWQVRSWLTGNLLVGSSGELPMDRAYINYREWARAQRYEPVPLPRFKKLCIECGVTPARVGRTVCFLNVSL